MESNDWPDPPPFRDRVARVIGDESVSAFSRRSGVPESTLRSYLTGRSSPGIEQAQKIADAGGVERYWLVTGRGSPQPAAAEDERTTAGPSPAAAPGVDPAWPLVLELVIDAYHARRRDIPGGRALRELVDAVVVLLRMEKGEICREKAISKIDAVL